MSWLSKLAGGGLLGVGGIGLGGGVIGAVSRLNRADTKPMSSPLVSVPNSVVSSYKTKQGVIDTRSPILPTTPGPGLFK